jgi:hypothetical protein
MFEPSETGRSLNSATPVCLVPIVSEKLGRFHWPKKYVLDNALSPLVLIALVSYSPEIILETLV